jgi:succinate-semialdehyde dehydrogenase/glutarate-semialdehyde dehydrogenase
MYKPVEVSACFTVWNLPVPPPIRKIAPASAEGCAVVCRSSEEGSVYAAEQLVKCLLDVGLLPGAISPLLGCPEVVSTLSWKIHDEKGELYRLRADREALIDKSADTVRRLMPEVGGHAPVIIFEDIDSERIAHSAVGTKFRNNGQVCSSPTRIYVHRSRVENITDAFVRAAAGLKAGSGLM